MAAQKCRFIHNQDSTDFFVTAKEPATGDAVDRMVDAVAERGVDVFLVNPSSQQASYPSKVWQRYWDGYKAGDDSFFGLPDDCTEGSLELRGHWLGQMQHLAEVDGCDYLARALKRCRVAGIMPGISMRMNDIHDAPWPNSHIHSDFYKAHPEWHLDGIAPRGWAGKALNYMVPEVREHYIKHIREIAEGYDFDFMELDFLRFPDYFNREDAQAGKAVMTDFVRKVRQLLDKKGNRVELVPRLAATPGGADELGFDIRTWVKEGLVDGLIVSEFLRTGWELPLDRWREVVGPDFPIYAGADSPARYWPGQPVIRMLHEPELIRGFAAGCLSLGASGIYFFNFFPEWIDGEFVHPDFESVTKAGDVEGLRGLSRRHLVSAGLSQIESDLALQTPVDVEDGGSRKFDLLALAEADGMSVEVRVLVDREVAVKDLWLRCNDKFVGCASSIGDGLGGQPATYMGKFTLPAGVLRDGWNELVVRLENGAATIVGVEVAVGC